MILQIFFIFFRVIKLEWKLMSYFVVVRRGDFSRLNIVFQWVDQVLKDGRIMDKGYFRIKIKVGIFLNEVYDVFFVDIGVR